MNVWISIINFNGAKNTIDCLNSLKDLLKDGFNLNIVVIDNGSKEKLSLSIFADLPIKVLRSERNLGFSGGHNKGIKYAVENRADFVVILNNDTVVDRKLILELLQSANSDSGIGIIAPKIYFFPGFEFHKNRYKKVDLGKVFWYAGGKIDWKNVIGVHRGVDEVDKNQYEKTEETDFASGCCMMIRADIFKNVGLFDEKYFLYYEDNDLSLRARKKGFKIVYNPKAILWHKNAASAGGSGSYLQDYYITRNRLMFGLKYAPVRSKIALIKESVKFLFKGRNWQRKGIVDFYLGNFGKGSFNI